MGEKWVEYNRWSMGRIWMKYGRNMSEIWAGYGWNMGETWVE